MTPRRSGAPGSGGPRGRRTARRGASAGRWLRALAVTLPLGFDPQVQATGAPPRAPLPDEAVADRTALGAIGLMWDEGRVCVSIGLRRGADAPVVGHAFWRPSGGPSQATVVSLERVARAQSPGDFDLWSACALAPEPRAGAALSTLLLDPSDQGGQRRRIDLPAGERGTWAWRLIHPLESTVEVLPARRAAAPSESSSRSAHGAAAASSSRSGANGRDPGR